jgi:hypothetical protein
MVLQFDNNTFETFVCIRFGFLVIRLYTAFLYIVSLISVSDNNIFAVKKIIPLKHVLWFWAYVNCFIFMSYPVKNFLGCLRNI